MKVVELKISEKGYEAAPFIKLRQFYSSKYSMEEFMNSIIKFYGLLKTDLKRIYPYLNTNIKSKI